MNKKNNQTTPWYNDDSLWKICYPILFPQARWDAAPQEVTQVLELLEISPSAHVLDLCCGPGRHSLELTRQGFQVTGVDRTAQYITEANDRAQAENLNVNFIQKDIRQFSQPDTFDAAINMFTSFGYFQDPADDRQVLVNVHRSLKPGGKLLLDLMSKEVMARIFRPRTWDRRDGTIVLEEHTLSQNFSWIQCQWTILNDNQQHQITFNHRLYSAAELSALLLDVGFASVQCFGNLTAAPYDHQAQRLTIVAQK
ncbi:MAG: methyltransferase domain-containing protein [Sedimentisphaerales bacterium]|nr:methyltransferase domain-containing protein [Sedimentisphaerales bacterium]